MLPDPARALSLLKPTVRQASGYTLEARPVARKLNQNEAPWDPFPDLKAEILARAARADWNRYPEFAPADLKRRLANRHQWDPEGVLVGNGSNEVIQAALAATVRSGEAVLAPSPSFSLYRLLVGANEGRYVPVPLGPGFAYDVGALVEACRREQAKAIVLCSPNNPTGSVLPEGGLRRLLDQTDALLLCDEAYQDFGGGSAVPLLRESARVLVFRTFSKAMGLAGLRFGYALAHPSVVREIAKVMLPYNVNLVTLAAADVVLDHESRFAERTRSLVRERDRFVARIGGLKGITVFPGHGNFVLIRCEARPGAEVFRALLDDHGILVRDVSAAPGLAECLRISIGTREDMDATFEALQGLFPEQTGATGG
jgi:histidinol-phosphate aminotransferase